MSTREEIAAAIRDEYFNYGEGKHETWKFAHILAYWGEVRRKEMGTPLEFDWTLACGMILWYATMKGMSVNDKHL